jgi:hypothetical protein
MFKKMAKAKAAASKAAAGTKEDKAAAEKKAADSNSKSDELPTPSWANDPKTAYPPKTAGGFTKKSVRALAKIRKDEPVIDWNGVEHSREVWDGQIQDWEKKFPKLTKHPQETWSERSKATSSKKNINGCWDALPRTVLKSKWRDKFRVDMYGNVIAKDASDGSLCSFDVDHIFPWSRGGRSVMENFAAVQWDANRRVKKHRLVATLAAEEVNCGLTQVQFEALMEHAGQKAGAKKRGRDLQSMQDKVEGWLRRGPPKEKALSNFQRLVHNTNDGEKLWSFFEKYWGEIDEEEEAGSDSPTVSVSLKAADDLTRPPILVSIDEIWAMRCKPARPLATTLSTDCAFLTYCRYVDFEHDLEPLRRGEKLHEEPKLEYAVHGRYKMDEAAEIHGCWWFKLKELVRIFSEEAVTAKLDAFEKQLASERNRAMQRVCAEIAEEDGGT